MLESSNIFPAGLPTTPPLCQLAATPAKPDVSTESYMGNRIGAATPALFPHPSRRDAPSLGEFLCGQNFTEKAVSRGVLCSDLCSNVFHVFLSMSCGVWRIDETAIPPSARRITTTAPLLDSGDSSHRPDRRSPAATKPRARRERNSAARHCAMFQRSHYGNHHSHYGNRASLLLWDSHYGFSAGLSLNQ